MMIIMSQLKSNQAERRNQRAEAKIRLENVLCIYDVTHLCCRKLQNYSQLSSDFHSFEVCFHDSITIIYQTQILL